MSISRLTLELDQSAEELHPGDLLKGAAVVTTDADVSCTALRVHLEWLTQGYGGREERQVASETVFSGEWATGSHRHSFSFRLPSGPISYNGQRFFVAWRLLCEVVTPDVRTQTELPLIMAPHPARRRHITRLDRHAAPSIGLAEPRSLDPPIALGYRITAITMGVMTLALALIHLTIAPIVEDPAAFGPYLLLALGSLTLLAGLGPRTLMARILTGRVRVGVQTKLPGEDTDYRQGDSTEHHAVLQVKVHVGRHKLVGAEQSSATLTIQEVSRSGTGIEDSYLSKDLHRAEQPLRASPDDPRELQGEFVLPRTAYASFHSKYHELTWSLRIRLAIANAPDRIIELPLVARFR